MLDSPLQSANQLLMALPPGEYKRLIPHLEAVNLALGEVI